MVVGDLAEPLVSCERQQRVEVVGVRCFGKGRRTAGAGGKVLELLEERRELRSFLTRLVGDAGRGQEPAHGEALRRRSAAHPPCRA